MYPPLECTSAFVGRMLLKINTALVPRMRYKECNFDCDRSKFRALLEKCPLLGLNLGFLLRDFPDIRNSLHAYDTNGGSLVSIGQ